MKKYAPLALVVGFLILALVRFGVRHGFQFGPTNGEVIEQYQSQFEPLHSTLAAVVTRIDGLPPVEETKLALMLDPKPTLIVTLRNRYTATIRPKNDIDCDTSQ